MRLGEAPTDSVAVGDAEAELVVDGLKDVGEADADDVAVWEAVVDALCGVHVLEAVVDALLVSLAVKKADGVAVRLDEALSIVRVALAERGMRVAVAVGVTSSSTQDSNEVAPLPPKAVE